MTPQLPAKSSNLISAVVMAVMALVILAASSAFAADDPNAAAKKKAEQECQDAFDSAKAICSGSSAMGQGMTAAQQGQQQQLQQQQQTAQNATQQAGAQQAAQCKAQADLSKIMSGISALAGAVCLGAVASCNSACAGNGKKEPTDDAKPNTDGGKPNANLQTSKMKSLGKQCEALGTQGLMALVQAAAMMAAGMINNQCAAQTATSPTPTAVTDCTNPDYAKTSVLCICQNDPKSAMCQAGQQFPSGISTSGGPQGPSSPLGADSSGASDGVPISGFEGQAKTASGSAQTEGGGGGGFGGGGKGLQALAGGDGAGGGPGGAPASVIQGTSGGSGGGGSGGGGSGGGGGGHSGGGRSGDPGKMNLSGYLPRQAGRNIAGMSIPAVHGITGPLGPSIFEKVTSQYQLQRKNMIQDR